MSVVVDLPNCVQCGAAPEERGQLECAYCGAVLPWELWDELSKRRVEVTPVQETALDKAIKRARRSVGRMRRRRKRLRTAANEGYEEKQRTAVLVCCGLFGVWALASWAIEDSVARTILFAVFGGALWGFVDWTRRRQDAVRFKRRRALRRHGKVRFAASVLAVSQPELTPGTETYWRRVVTLHVSRGHQRVLLADANVVIRAGDTGIAKVLGNELVGFRVHENVVESPGEGTAAG